MLPYGRSFSIVRGFSTPPFRSRLYANVLLPLSAAFPSHSAAYAHYPFGSESVKIRRPSFPPFFSYGHYPLDSVPMSCASRSLSLFTLITVFSTPNTSFHPHYLLLPPLPSFLLRLHYRLFRLHYCLFHPYGHYPFPSEIARISGFRSLPDPIIEMRSTHFHFTNFFYIKYCKKSKYEL